MVQGEAGEKDCADEHRDEPCPGNVARPCFQYAGNDDKDALAENRGQTVEGASDADKKGLAAAVKHKHVISVGCYVMGRRGQCRNPENDKGQ